MNLFNYFGELKQKFQLPYNIFNSYNVINIGGRLAYIEGHKGLLKLADDIISLKLKTGYIEIKGNGLYLKNLTEDTVVIQGKIYKIEVF